MKSLSGKEFTRALERRGWRLLRINGSHHIYGKVDRVERLSVPIHSNKPMKIGLLRHLMKCAGLREGDLK
ncbi:MAG: type II toxin-antitoxin system HicA family toxin [Nitrospinales bacterium]